MRFDPRDLPMRCDEEPAFVQILEERGPLRAGDVKIGGGFALWVRQIELIWNPPREGYDPPEMWTLKVHVSTCLPDRFDPSKPVNVEFGREHVIEVDEDGNVKSGLRVDETEHDWVAHRIFDTLEWIARHEVAESVMLDGKPVVDAHKDRWLATYP